MIRRREALCRMAAAGLVVAGLGGCSTVNVSPDDAIVTGSIRATPASLPVPDGLAPTGIAPSDWVQAKIALDQALAARNKDVSIPWDNPETGSRGTATPVGAARAGGCRDFMISLVDGKTADRWIQGEVCKARSGTVLSQVRVLGQA
ncbi:conserved hypothetical protein; putative signal peptide [Xanthobacter versatilis]|uniref:Surface antigen domain-containing protein n=2 Tax=Xanthobacter autotrophicus (strain ATCC BAA-1158 / Py2) TaxID=78245 RepID=A7II78_XANP2|nr:conserved hypothetical protein; putative signal peptide [Xanthobacter autotrophicus Py2]